VLDPHHADFDSAVTSRCQQVFRGGACPAARGYQVFRHWFEKKHDSNPSAPAPAFAGPKVPRHSGGWAALRKRLQAESGLRVIDVGSTSSANINYLASLGHSIFLADLVNEACTGNWQTGADENGDRKSVV
jgi:hypothetical protein